MTITLCDCKKVPWRHSRIPSCARHSKEKITKRAIEPGIRDPVTLDVLPDFDNWGELGRPDKERNKSDRD